MYAVCALFKSTWSLLDCRRREGVCQFGCVSNFHTHLVCRVSMIFYSASDVCIIVMLKDFFPPSRWWCDSFPGIQVYSDGFFFESISTLIKLSLCFTETWSLLLFFKFFYQRYIYLHLEVFRKTCCKVHTTFSFFSLLGFDDTPFMMDTVFDRSGRIL